MQGGINSSDQRPTGARRGGPTQLPGACQGLWTGRYNATTRGPQSLKGGVQSHARGPAGARKGGWSTAVTRGLMGLARGSPLLHWGPTGAPMGFNGSDRWPARTRGGGVHCHAQCPGGTHRGGSLVCMGAHQGLNGKVLCHVREPARARSRESTAAPGVLWWLAAEGQLPCPGALGACGQGCAEVPRGPPGVAGRGLPPRLGTSQQLPVDVC